ncbi:hypothetical protein FORC065_2638 [Yersinia enterocolitica]|nr:hypothetical protein FORC065_2638 [Yersinia enterocolitica]
MPLLIKLFIPHKGAINYSDCTYLEHFYICKNISSANFII